MTKFNNRWQELLLPIGIIGCLALIFVPLPAQWMDLFLAANIGVAVLILLGTIYAKSPLELSIFPSLLLATTFSRLALNIATTRLILANGAAQGEAAAGDVIRNFANFVSGDSLVIGFVIFSIIVIVQFVVITKGATRISEVSARFALDGLPGRQMAIDAELNAGTITSEQARTLRAETFDHAEFYGAMDGASKFVRGDAIAGIIIMLVNIVGGIGIGLYNQMSITDAVNTFTKLTIGDGLASQVPALLISLAAALLITRSTRKVDLAQESLKQVFGRPIALVLTASFLFIMAFTELPKAPLILLTVGCLGLAWRLNQNNKQSLITKPSRIPEKTPASTSAPPELSMDKLLNHELIEMVLGRSLIRLADSSNGGGLLNLINKVRQQVAMELGVILPRIRVRDNLEIGPNEIHILVQGNIAFRGRIDPNLFLAIDRGQATAPINSHGLRGMAPEGFLDCPAFWIVPDAFESTLAIGYEVLTAEEVMAEQLRRIAHRNAPLILTRDATKQLIDELHRRSPAVVDELIPNQMTLSQVQKILKGLLEEGVSVRPLELILETLGDNIKLAANYWELIEKVRLRLSRHITSRLQNPATGEVYVYTIEESLQDRIAAGWQRNQDEIRIGLPREIVESLVLAIEGTAVKMAAAGYEPILMVNQAIRPVIAELTMEVEPKLVVISNREIQGAEVQVLGEISADQINTVRSAA